MTSKQSERVKQMNTRLYCLSPKLATFTSEKRFTARPAWCYDDRPTTLKYVTLNWLIIIDTNVNRTSKSIYCLLVEYTSNMQQQSNVDKVVTVFPPDLIRT